MCFISYPVAGTDPRGKINWKSHRLSQQYESQWAAIETSAGVYSESALAALDSIVTLDREQGASVIMGLYRTPRFYANNTTPNPTVTDYNATGPWGHLGECAHPTSLQAVENFVEMLVTRYNLPGGAWYDQHGATLGKGIQYWEPWNEPTVSASSTNATGFYWGNKQQLVDLCAVQYNAIKALDATIEVCSPGFSTAPVSIGEWLNTSGSVYSSTTGSDVTDAVAWHPYGKTPKFNAFGAWYADIIDSSTGIRTLRNAIIASGHDFPLWITEWGVDASGDSPTLTAWDAETAEFRRTWIQRVFMNMAANGVKMVHPWHWESDCCFGDLQNDADGVQAAYNWFAENISGKTITSARYHTDGRVSITVNGTEITV